MVKCIKVSFYFFLKFIFELIKFITFGTIWLTSTVEFAATRIFFRKYNILRLIFNLVLFFISIFFLVAATQVVYIGNLSER